MLASATLLTQDKVYEVMAFCHAFTPVLKAILVVGRGLKDTMAEKRGEVGQVAFRSLRIGRSLKLAEGLDQANLLRSLEQIEEAFKRPRKPKIEREFNKALGNARRELPRLTVSVTTEPPAVPAANLKAG